MVGAVFVNAVTGGHTYYDLADVPSWADHICPADLLVEQYDYYGAFNDGFFNAYIGQRGVTHTTEDYNYIAMNDDVFVYTGVTSVSSDQSNIGFLLCNQRTKEAKFYPVSGATEQSAQSSAQGAVAVSYTHLDVYKRQDQDSSVLALAENLQRQDLDFYEEAQGIARLIHVHGLTQQQAADKLGKTQSAIANKLRLLRLPPEVIALLRQYRFLSLIHI